MQVSFNPSMLVAPVVFDWRPIEAIPHTYAAQIDNVWIGLYEQPSDKSHWISITGAAGDRFPTSPKKFPDRSSAEQWAADTLRLILLARTEKTAMNDPKKPNETDPKPPADDEPKQPGPDFVENPSDETDDGDWGEDDLEVDDDDDGL